jgi:site-specific recombinase XerD
LNAVKSTSPSFLDQKHMDDTLRAMLRRTLFQATGSDPTEAELDIAVRREFAQLSVRLRRADETGPLSPAAPAAAFSTLPDARAQPESAKATAASHATWMSPAELRDAEAATIYARTHGMPCIVDAVRWYHVRRGSTQSAPFLPQCVDEFLCVKRSERRSAMTISGYRSKLDRFAAAFATKRPAEITPHEIGRFITAAKHPTTRRDWWETLSTFYKWCVGVNYAEANPLPLALARPARVEGAQLVLSPDETREILRLTKHTDQIGFWALSLFAGLRTEEIRRIQADAARWSIVRVESGVIDLPAAVGKNGARLVPISPVMSAWLKWIRARNAPFFPPNHFLKCQRLRDAVMAERCASLAERHQATQSDVRAPIWAFNVARRSYISYQLATAGASYADVSREVGNSEAMLRKNYERRVSRDDAKEYFSLKPGRV